ncbi:MAG: hypothetical protein QM723_27010 [Myxococcaceae bacterium]
MKRLAVLLALVMFVSPAFAASQLDALKATAASARQAVNDTRHEQMAKTQELNQLSGRIEALKANAKGKLLPGSELDSALKQSQELSGALTTLAQSLSEKEAALEQSNVALLTAMTDEMKALRAEFDRQTSHAGRAATIAKMKALKNEREQVRAAIPSAKVPSLANLKESDSDDPTELLEQADQVRDDEDKVRSQLKALESRINEAKAERDLDSRMRQFSGEENLFDDQDRRLRVRRETFENAAGGTTQNPTTQQSDNQFGGTPNGPAPSAPPPPKTTVGDTAGASRNNGLGAFGAASPVSLDTSKSANPQAGGEYTDGQGVTHKFSSANDARPVIGKQGSGSDDDDDLNELEVQRLKLKSLADQLKSRADSLQKKAAQLR